MFIRGVMACVLFCAVALVVASSFGEDSGKVSSSTESTAAKGKGLEQELIRLNKQLAAAENKGGDIPTLERLYTADYTHTHSRGRVDSRVDYLNFVKPSGSPYIARDLSNEHVRIYNGTTAIINGHMHLISSNSGESENNFMAVWVLQQGKWRVAAWVTSCLSRPTGKC